MVSRAEKLIDVPLTVPMAILTGSEFALSWKTIKVLFAEVSYTELI